MGPADTLTAWMRFQRIRLSEKSQSLKVIDVLDMTDEGCRWKWV